ncbi:Alanine racemase, partial [hydrothermal vent metagenome]
MSDISSTVKLHLDSDALISNWRALDEMSGSANAGAAVKANAYGLGAIETTRRLQSAGCRDFFVANWQEASEIEPLIDANTKISVLNGIRPEDMKTATSSRAKPVLNTIEQIKRWSVTNRPCDIMINTGMNRLGIDAVDLAGADVGALSIDMAMSHLASADEDRQQNTDQLNEYTSSIAGVVAKRFSLANSAGIALGPKYQFDCTRPGLSLYGGIPRNELSRIIRQVVFPQAQI